MYPGFGLQERKSHALLSFPSMLHSTTYNRWSLVYWKRMCYVRLWLWRQLWGLIWVFLGFFLGCFLLIFYHIAAIRKSTPIVVVTAIVFFVVFCPRFLSSTSHICLNLKFKAEMILAGDGKGKRREGCCSMASLFLIHPGERQADRWLSCDVFRFCQRRLT